MIEVENLTKYFGDVKAVNGVTFHVNSGEILGLLGPNGAGKTTTMRILTGFYPPTRGKATVAGHDVLDESLAVRKKIGYLPENVPLYGEMTVTDYLNFVAEVKGVPRSHKKRSVGDAVADCRLTPVENRYIKKLSKGFRQRVGLAQALIGDPDVLILDEPTIGLDPRQINEMRSVIKSFAGEKTVILSTHILPEVSMTCHRVVIVNQGRVVAEDTPANLSAQLSGAALIKIQVDGPRETVQDALENVAGVKAVTHFEDGVFSVEADGDIRPRLAAAVCSSGWDLFELTRTTATLEDVFLELVTSEAGAAHD